MKIFKSISYASVFLCSITIFGSGISEKTASTKEHIESTTLQDIKQKIDQTWLLVRQGLPSDDINKRCQEIRKQLSDVPDNIKKQGVTLSFLELDARDLEPINDCAVTTKQTKQNLNDEEAQNNKINN